MKMDYYSVLITLIKAFGIFSALLLLGTFLRAKVPIFQSLYLPASVIGGFIGLLLGPNVLNLIPFGEDVMSIASNVPSVLITPVFAAIPMCARLSQSDTHALKKSNDILVLTMLLGGFFLFQCCVGIVSTMVTRLLGGTTYDVMGMELAYGFNGGHGMAASLGSALKDFGNPNWQAAQDMGMTTATVGLVGGIVIGVILINFAIKKGYTSQIRSAKEADSAMRTGLYARDDQLPELCKQTTVSNSIETLSLHLALILVASAIGYWLEGILSQIDNIIFASMAGWFYAMLVMLVLWRMIRLLKWDHHFDEAVKNKISGFLTDYIVVAAIMSINIQMLADYWMALLIMCAAGLVITPLCIYLVCKKFLQTNWFEKSLGVIGSNTGVFVTGVLLIKMADPELRTDALNDYSIAATLCNLFAMPLISLELGVMNASGAPMALALAAAISIACFVPIVVSHFALKKAVG